MSEEHLDSLKYTAVNFLGSFLSIFITFFIVAYRDHATDWYRLTEKGDVVIICASLVISSIYSLYTFKKDLRTGFYTLIYWLAILLFIICLVQYVVVSILQPDEGNRIGVFWSSAIVALFTLIFTYISQYFQNINSDVISEREKEKATLESNFKQLRGKEK